MANQIRRPYDTRPAGDLQFCGLCNQWRYGGGKPFKMTHAQFVQLHKDRLIDASSALG